MLVSHFLSEKQAHTSVSCRYLSQKLLQRLLAAGKQFVLLTWRTNCSLVSADSLSVPWQGLLDSFVLICNLFEQLAFFLLCV